MYAILKLISAEQVICVRLSSIRLIRSILKMAFTHNFKHDAYNDGDSSIRFWWANCVFLDILIAFFVAEFNDL